MKSKQAFGMCAGVLLLIGGAQVQADPFIRPPETYAPVWFKPFPYQRNIDMNFAISPVSSPGSGIPGANYAGKLDSSVLSSDYVTFTNGVSWYGSVPGANFPTGLIGIDNRGGSGAVTGSAVFHIDSSYDPDCGEVWLELSYGLGTGSSLGINVECPFPSSALYIGGLSDLDLGNGFVLHNEEWEITQGIPEWETITVTFSVPAGEYALVDELHIATEVPEPSTPGLLLAGGLAGLCVLWRRQR